MEQFDIDVLIEGCNFTNNAADYGSGLVMGSSNTIVRDCIIAGNIGAQLSARAPSPPAGILRVDLLLAGIPDAGTGRGGGVEGGGEERGVPLAWLFHEHCLA